MCLFDTADGILMQRAYRWAFLHPLRKLYYNLTVTALSVAVGIGGAELIVVLHERAHLTDPVTTWIAGLGMDDVGFYIVGLFLAVWLIALAGWRLLPGRGARPVA